VLTEGLLITVSRSRAGNDGFEDALKQIAAIEQEFGLADLAALTAPPPPAA